MKRRTAYWIVGGAVVGTAVVAIVATSAPAAKKLATMPGGITSSTERMVQRAKARAGQTRVPYFATKLGLSNDPDADAVKRFSIVNAQNRRAESKRRLHVLQLAHKDARPVADKYSTAAFPVWEPQDGASLQYGQWHWIDEYGRNFGEEAGKGFGLGTVVEIAQIVLPYVPGIGTAGSMALAASIAVAQGKSAQDVAMATARASLPPYAQIAFDVGVAVGSGERVDKAAQGALIDQLEAKYPGARAAYAEGKALA